MIKKENLILEKSFLFAIETINLYKYICEKKREYVISKQLLRSGTSIGANVEESLGGQSKKDFLAKMSIAYKEVRETMYWLKLLFETKYLSKKQFDHMYKKAEELCKIITRIQITTKKNLHTK